MNDEVCIEGVGGVSFLLVRLGCSGCAFFDADGSIIIAWLVKGVGVVLEFWFAMHCGCFGNRCSFTNCNCVGGIGVCCG